MATIKDIAEAFSGHRFAVVTITSYTVELPQG